MSTAIGAEYTPGPWTGMARPNNHGAYILGPDKRRIATAEEMANARLIVAAPELLAALKDLVAALDERDIRMMALTRCRQAIAAAERRPV